MTERKWCRHSVLIESYSGARSSCCKEALPTCDYCLEHASSTEVIEYFEVLIRELEEYKIFYNDVCPSIDKMQEMKLDECHSNLVAERAIATITRLRHEAGIFDKDPPKPQWMFSEDPNGLGFANIKGEVVPLNEESRRLMREKDISQLLLGGPKRSHVEKDYEEIENHFSEWANS